MRLAVLRAATIVAVFASLLPARAEVFRQQYGLTSPTGAATLTSSPDGMLVVGDIGSSGLDGVDFFAGGTRGAIGPVRWMAPESITDKQYKFVVTSETEEGLPVVFEVRSKGLATGGDEVHVDPRATGASMVHVTYMSLSNNPLYEELAPMRNNPLYESSAPPNGAGAGLPGASHAALGLADFTWFYPEGTIVRVGEEEPMLVSRVVFDLITPESQPLILRQAAMRITDPSPQGGELRITEVGGATFGRLVGRVGDASVIGVSTPGLDGVDRLRLSNIGSSGQDGVSADFGPNDASLAYSLDGLGTPVDGAELRLHLASAVATGTPLPVVVCRFADGAFDLFTDLATSAAPTRVELLLDGEVVRVSPVPAATIRLLTSVQWPYQFRVHDPDLISKQDAKIEVSLLGPTDVDDGSGITVSADAVRMIHSPEQGSPFPELSEVMLTAANVAGGTFDVVGMPNSVAPQHGDPYDEFGFRVFDGLSQSNAFVVLDTETGALWIDNIGSSGLDGVSVDLGSTQSFGTTRDFPPSGGHHGHVTVLKLFGTTNGGGPGVFGEITASVGDAFTEIGADMSGQGADDLRYDFYRNGVRVRSRVCGGDSSTCYGCDGIPTSSGGSLMGAGGQPSLSIAHPAGSQITFFGATGEPTETFEADHVVIEPDRIVTPFTDITDSVWRLSGGGAVQITSLTVSTSVSAPSASRAGLALDPATPNPFNPRTVLQFALPRSEDVSISIVDARGRRVLRRDLGALDAGRHEFLWDGLDEDGHAVASGVYFARVRAGADEASTKMALVR